MRHRLLLFACIFSMFRSTDCAKQLLSSKLRQELDELNAALAASSRSGAEPALTYAHYNRAMVAQDCYLESKDRAFLKLQIESLFHVSRSWSLLLLGDAASASRSTADRRATAQKSRQLLFSAHVDGTRQERIEDALSVLTNLAYALSITQAPWRRLEPVLVAIVRFPECSPVDDESGHLRNTFLSSECLTEHASKLIIGLLSEGRIADARQWFAEARSHQRRHAKAVLGIRGEVFSSTDLDVFTWQRLGTSSFIPLPPPYSKSSYSFFFSRSQTHLQKQQNRPTSAELRHVCGRFAGPWLCAPFWPCGRIFSILGGQSFLGSAPLRSDHCFREKLSTVFGGFAAHQNDSFEGRHGGSK